MQDIENIYHNYSNMIYKYIFCLTGNEDISEEIVQETFLIAVKNIDKFESKSKISTWLCSIAKNVWYKELRKEKKLQKIPIESIGDSLFINESIEEKICEKEIRIEIFKKIQKLDEDMRNVIYLRTFGNLSYDEIAQIMNRSTSWARTMYFRGKQKLKEMEKGWEEK